MRFKFFATLICGAGLALPSAASAATITVETKADDSPSQCSLRDAIDAANDNTATGGCPAGQGSPTVDTINFSVPSNPTEAIDLLSPLPTIASSLDIVGPGADELRVSGGDAVQVLALDFGTVSISGLTLERGFVDGVGAGITNGASLTLSGVSVTDNEAVDTISGPTDSFPEGGGIHNQGTLTIVNSTVSDNQANASDATSQNAPEGGGIFNNGTLTLDRSTVSGNTANASAGGGNTTNATGGGITNFGTLHITRSTVSGNTATAAGGSSSNQAVGGAVAQANSPAAHLNVSRSTVSGNFAMASGTSASEHGGGLTGGASDTIAVTGSTITGNSAAVDANLETGTASTYRGTIVSNPQGGGVNCGFGGVSSQGYNLEDTGTCGFTESTDHSNTAITGLDPNLADNGGPTRTHALFSGSPAIDQGSGSCTTDQRGLASPSDFNGVANAAGGNGTDIGAFERQDATPPNTNITSGPATGTQTTDRAQTFGFKATEACSTFQCRVDSGPFSGCKSPHTTGSLPDGAHTFAVRALDGGHHADATPATRTFTVDTTGPETQITKAPKKKVKTRKKRKKAKFRFSSPEPAASFECSLDDAAFEPCASPFKTKVKKGKHEFEVRASDALGNTGPPDTHSWKVKRKRR